jgi:hypothetical protein
MFTGTALCSPGRLNRMALTKAVLKLDLSSLFISAFYAGALVAINICV